MLALFLTFFKIGAFTFGGGYAMISMIEDECVDRKKWMNHDELLNMTVIAESTPGPIAINCATYVGYKRMGFKGALASTLGVILPSLIIIISISKIFTELLVYPIVERAFAGIRVAVAVLIMQAAVRMFSQMKKTEDMEYKKDYWFVALYFLMVMAFYILGIHFSVIYMIIISGLIGFSIYEIEKIKKGKR